MKHLVLLTTLLSLNCLADSQKTSRFIVETERDFKSVCTKDGGECKCFIYKEGWTEFQCPKQIKQAEK